MEAMTYHGEHFTAEQCESFVEQWLAARPRTFNHATLLAKTVAYRHGVPWRYVLGTGRSPRITQCREAIVMKLREVADMSYPEIARVMGRRSHSTFSDAHKRAMKRSTA